MERTELIFEQSLQGKDGTNHCFSYSPKCGKCRKEVGVRSTRESSIETVKIVELVFQCDNCKLKWVSFLRKTNKNVRNLKEPAAQKAD